MLEDLRKHRFPQRFRSSLPTEVIITVVDSALVCIMTLSFQQAQFVEWLMALQSPQRPSAQEVYSSVRFKQLQRVSEHSGHHIITKL